MAAGVLFALFLKADPDKAKTHTISFKDINPFQAFLEARHFLNVAMVLLFFVVFLTSVSYTHLMLKMDAALLCLQYHQTYASQSQVFHRHLTQLKVHDPTLSQ